MVIYQFLRRKKILISDKDNWNTVDLPNDKIAPLDIKLLGDKLFILDEDSLLSYNFENEKWNKCKLNTNLSKIIEKSNNLFGLTNNGEIILLKFNEDAKEFDYQSIYDVTNLNITSENLTDLEYVNNKLILATTPIYYWEEWERNKTP